MRSGVSNTSRNFRSRAGPIVGSMLSAMQASVGVMELQNAELSRLDGVSPYQMKTESRRRPGRRALLSVAEPAGWNANRRSFLHPLRLLRRHEERRASAYFPR